MFWLYIELVTFSVADTTFHRMYSISCLFNQPVASIQIYFEGAKFFSPQGGERSFSPKSARPEGSRARVGFLGRGIEPSPPARGSWGAL